MRWLATGDAKKAAEVFSTSIGVPRWVQLLSILVGSMVVVMALPWASHWRSAFYSRQTGWVVLSWEYVSSPVEYEDAGGGRLAHMRLRQGQRVRRRAAVEVRLIGEDGDTILQRRIKPRGLRGDAIVVVYAEVPVVGRFWVECTEEGLPGQVWRSQMLTVRPGESVCIEFARGHFRLQGGKEG